METTVEGLEAKIFVSDILNWTNCTVGVDLDKFLGIIGYKQILHLENIIRVRLF